MMLRLRQVLKLMIAAVILPVGAAPSLANEASLAEEQAIQAAVAAVADSVVQIETVGGLEKVGRVLTSTAPTTGVVVSEDGYIVSSSFNFVQQPSVVLVSLSSGQEFPAKVVARDKSRRLVLLKIDPKQKQLSVPETVKRSNLQVGQWAIAVGRSFDTSAPNISVGIVSATERIWGRAIQTDAKVSPVNYGGPLIDIQGRVMGILVPLSTEDGSELAGAEMYDSGIGFAVPLSEILLRLDDMIAGKELMPGLMGLTLKSKDLYRGAPEVASTAPKSPAREAGIQVGDRILKANGRKVTSQAQLKHAVGPLYAGDTLEIVLLRDGQEASVNLTLAAKIEPYVHPFLGILPERTSDEALEVRYVYPNSPAEAAELQRGDILTSLDETAPATIAEWRALIAGKEPGTKIAIEYRRGDKPQTVELELAALPEVIPDDLPPPRQATPSDKPPGTDGDAADEDDAAAADVDVVEVTLPAEGSQCFAIIPRDHAQQTPMGLVVWLAPPKFESQQKLVERWSGVVNQHHLIVLAPQPINEDRWLPTEAAVVRKFMDQAIKKYNVDPERVVVHGFQAGGSLAHRVALANRDVVRAAAIVDAATPRGAEFRSNDPIERLAYFLFGAKESRLFKFMERDLKGLRALKFPVTEVFIDGETRYLNDTELVILARWIDSLDRL